MTEDNGTKRRRLWVGAGVAVLGAGVVARGLIRSGTVTIGLLDHWYGQVAVAVVALLVVGVGLHLVNRAYRR